MDEGFVIGLTGPWGTGKTSVLALLEAELEDAAVVWFEPWLFTGANELVDRFFGEISAQLAQSPSDKLQKIGERLASYGEALSPFLKILNSGLGELAGAAAAKAAHRPAASTVRRELCAELEQDPQRIVVLIDDIDRLDEREVREVMRLVKLVADLPGVVHVLAYDRLRVETALSEGAPETGQGYLEKIVQASLAIPLPSRSALLEMSLGWLDEAIDTAHTVGVDSRRWQRLLFGGVDRYLRTPRDGRRFANMAPAVVSLCATEVATEDVLALEAIRVFDPGFHDRLLVIADILVGEHSPWDLRSETERREERQRRIDESLTFSRNPSAARHILAALFPRVSYLFDGNPYDFTGATAAQWLQAKRVASGQVFRRYLHLALDRSEVASTTVDEAVKALADEAALRELLAGVSTERMPDLLGRLVNVVGEQPNPDVTGAASALYEVIPRLDPARDYSLDPTRSVLWIVEELVASAAADDREGLATALIEAAPTLSLRQTLIDSFRSVPDKPSRRREIDVVPQATWDRYEASLAASVRDAPEEQLAGERSVYFLLVTLHERLGAEAVLGRLRDQQVLIQVLKQSGTSVRGHTGTDRVSLDLAPLERLAGPEVFSLLEALQHDDGALDLEVRIELGRELAQRRSSRS